MDSVGLLIFFGGIALFSYIRGYRVGREEGCEKIKILEKELTDFKKKSNDDK